jgi:hypothetical protein
MNLYSVPLRLARFPHCRNKARVLHPHAWHGPEDTYRHVNALWVELAADDDDDCLRVLCQLIGPDDPRPVAGRELLSDCRVYDNVYFNLGDGAAFGDGPDTDAA